MCYCTKEQLRGKPLRTQLVCQLLKAVVPMILATFVVCVHSTRLPLAVNPCVRVPLSQCRPQYVLTHLGGRCRVLITASMIGNNVKNKTAEALDAQIARHLSSASYEISAATQKRFKVVDNALVTPVAYALRDAVEADRPLASGDAGYPLDVPPTVLDWNFADETPSEVTPDDRATFPGRGLGDLCLPVGSDQSVGTECECIADVSVPDKCSGCELTRTAGNGECAYVPARLDTTSSAVYYSAGTTTSQENRNTPKPTADDPPTLSIHDQDLISATAAVDHWLAPLYERHTAIQQVYIGLELRDHQTAAFRHFPGKDATTEEGSFFACNQLGMVGFCYDASARGWYNTARQAVRTQERRGRGQGLGRTILTDPYQDAGSGDWMISIAKAVYKTNSNELIGVVGCDMLLSTIRESVLDFQMLDTGFAMLVDARHGTIVAAPERIYNPGPNDATQKICELMPAVCQTGPLASGGECYDEAPSEDIAFDEFEHDGTTYVFKGGCVEAEQAGTLTHVVLVLVPKSEIRQPIDAVNARWEETSSVTILLVSTLSAVTLIFITGALVQLGTDITKPIVLMSDVAKQITEHVFDEDEGVDEKRNELHNTVPQPDEVGDLLKEFKNMVTGIANDSKKKDNDATTADPKSKYPPNPCEVPIPTEDSWDLHLRANAAASGAPPNESEPPTTAPIENAPIENAAVTRVERGP